MPRKIWIFNLVLSGAKLQLRTAGLGVHNRFDAINILVHGLSSHGSDHLSGKEYILGVNDHLWEYKATRAEINHLSWQDTSLIYKKESYRYWSC